MASRLPQFTEPQWAFLAVLDALEEPVHIEVVGTLAPLLPGPLFDLLKRADEYNIIRKHDADVFGLGPNIPHGVHRKLKEMNTSAGLAALVDRLKDARLVARMNPASAARLFVRAGRPEEATRIEIDLTRKAIEGRNHETATRYLKQAAGQQDVHEQAQNQPTSRGNFLEERLHGITTGSPRP